jgi:alpha-pyrone synthase
MNNYITSIETAVPKYKISQKEVLKFMTQANGLDSTEAHTLEVLYRASGINTRYSIISDYSKEDGFTFFSDNRSLEPVPGTEERLKLFRKEAVQLSAVAASKCLKKVSIKTEQITHLITVSCTGIHAPGLDIDLVYELGLKTDVERLGINFMGCYAAFNAIKMADAICSSGKAKVLIVCTELCTLHFQKGKDEDNLLANALFGDGSAAILMESKTTATKYLKTASFNCDLLPNGIQEMAWNVGAFGFEMKLSTYVPDIIAEGINKLLSNLPKSFDFYAVHPGGKKILTVIEKSLGITKDDNLWAHDILRSYGNMSSPTILFVLKRIFDQLDKKDNNKEILSLAFGPGLTLESMVLKTNVDA